MGTDIHGRLQRRYYPEAPYTDEGPIEDDRNYRVFAMLAGVRNGVGFAGVKTHEPLVPISEPRGLPADLELVDGDSIKLAVWQGDESIEITEWIGDHSHSWLTLTEIDNWEGWSKSLAMTGIIDKNEYERIRREGGNPKSWCGWISGGRVKIVSADDAADGAEFTHVQWEWQVPFTEYTATFRAWIDYLLKKYGWLLDSDPEAVRIVFGFDS